MEKKKRFTKYDNIYARVPVPGFRVLSRTGAAGKESSRTLHYKTRIRHCRNANSTFAVEFHPPDKTKAIPPVLLVRASARRIGKCAGWFLNLRRRAVSHSRRRKSEIIIYNSRLRTTCRLETFLISHKSSIIKTINFMENYRKIIILYHFL